MYAIRNVRTFATAIQVPVVVILILMPTLPKKSNLHWRMPGAAGQVPQLFAQASAFHQNGQLREAATLCRQILSTQPKNSNVLHLLGLITAQEGDYRGAAQLLTEAVEANPSN